MRPDDGRAIPNFIRQALSGEPLTVSGDGTQTRSVCYVDDLVEGLFRLLMSPESGPVNLGNPHEMTVLELARLVIELTGSRSGIAFVDRPQDDPMIRQPDIMLARQLLSWEPQTPVVEGLKETITWFQDQADPTTAR
jgi:dTDP-glucose 4,6-dehydratase